MTEGQIPSGFFSGFESDAHMRRFLIAMLAFVSALAITALALVRVADLSFSGAGIEVNIAGQRVADADLKSISLESAGFMIETSKGNRFASILVPANQLWVDTNLRVKPGQTIQLRASGSANLAEQLNLNAINDPTSYEKIGFNFLVDPYGRRLNWLSSKANKLRNRNADELRNLIKLKPGYPLGSLVGTVQPNSAFIEQTPAPQDSFSILDEDSSGGYLYQGKVEGKLFLAVNDIVGNDRADGLRAWMLTVDPTGAPLDVSEHDKELCDAFPLEDCTEEGRVLRRQAMHDRWASMLKARHWEAFYEDNSGMFLVTVSISGK